MVGLHYGGIMPQPAPALTDADIVAPTQQQSLSLTEAARQLVAVEHNLQEAEELVERLKAQRRELAEVTIPDLMDAAGQDRIGLPEAGVDIELKPYYSASLPKDADMREAALRWLVENGHGDLIKSEVSVEFGRGEHNAARSVAAVIEEQLVQMDMLDTPVRQNETVHHMTFGGFVRREYEEGRSLPLTLLGATVGRAAKIKRRK
jgi:hypothetical protein